MGLHGASNDLQKSVRTSSSDGGPFISLCALYSIPLNAPPKTRQVPSGPISLNVQLPGITSCEVLDVTGPLVGHVKDAIIVKFKLDAPPQQLQLFKIGKDGSRTLLDPTQTLTEAGIKAGDTLEVVISVTGACSSEAGCGRIRSTSRTCPAPLPTRLLLQFLRSGVAC